MLISIIIPTRERARYLRHSLATALAIDDDRLEIIVSDNASTDGTRDLVTSLSDPRLRYLNPGDRVSMRMNFEFAFQHATGDYIISFGDDDGIIPGQFPMLRHLLATRRPDAASWSLPAYGWPVDGYGTKVGGIRFTVHDCFGHPERVEPAEARMILESGQMHQFSRLPRIYHGAMSRNLLDRMKDPAGVLFRARSPDIYASFRAVVMGGTFDFYPHPFSINGHSPASTGGSMNAVGDRQQGGAADTRFLVETRTDPVEDIIAITMSMALAYLGTAQTAAAVVPPQPFAPDYQRWYVAALRDMRRKGPEVAGMIDNSLIAHAAQFGAEKALSTARNSRGFDWSILTHKLSQGLGKIRKANSFRLLAEADGMNTIETAARMCDIVLAQDAEEILAGKMKPAEAWQRAIGRSGGYARQM